MIIDTPRLCNDVAFLPPQESKAHAIACTLVLPSASIPSYLAAKESQLASEDERSAEELDIELNDAINLLETGQIRLKPGNREFAGDIEIGAHKFIPTDKKLEKGVIVGGGKEKHLETIAKSDGYVAEEKVLRKLGIKSIKDMDAVKKEVEKAAKGKDWRLDVVETPRGKELRGVIETRGGNDEGSGTGDGSLQQDGEQSQDQQEGSEETYKEEL
jgi:protein OS-9